MGEALPAAHRNKGPKTRRTQRPATRRRTRRFHIISVHATVSSLRRFIRLIVSCSEGQNKINKSTVNHSILFSSMEYLPVSRYHARPVFLLVEHFGWSLLTISSLYIQHDNTSTQLLLAGFSFYPEQVQLDSTTRTHQVAGPSALRRQTLALQTHQRTSCAARVIPTTTQKKGEHNKKMARRSCLLAAALSMGDLTHGEVHRLVSKFTPSVGFLNCPACCCCSAEQMTTSIHALRRPALSWLSYTG